MLVETLVAIAIVIVTFLAWRRQHQFPQLKTEQPPAATTSNMSGVAATYDAIVVGAGAGGCAAAHSLLERGGDTIRQVLLVEAGGANIGSMQEALNFAADLPGSAGLDYHLRSGAPFAEGPNDGVPYPRGRGLGGTSSIDWGMHLQGIDPVSGEPAKEELEGSGVPGFTDVSPANGNERKSTAPSASRQVSLCTATMRSPLSWAFVESCRARGTRGALGSVTSVLLEHGVSPILQRISAVTGTRRFIPHALLTRPGDATTLRQGLRLHCGARVSRVVVESGRATGIELANSVKIAARHGVIVASGVAHTPVILKSSCPSLSSSLGVNFSDAIGVPLIYQAKPGLSDDPTNTQSLKNIIAWYAMRKGSILNAVCDSALVASVPGLEGAEVAVLFQPAGGYRTVLWRRMNYSKALAVFPEAFTFWICVQKLPKSLRSSDDESSMGSLEFPSDESSGLPSFAGSKLSDRQREAVLAILRHGIRMCREMVSATGPLRQLSSGREAIDCSLLKTDSRSVIFRALYGTGAKKKVKLQDAAVQKLLEEARELAMGDEYVDKYIATHGRFMGYGVGSTANVTKRAGGKPASVDGVDNLFVGDVSMIPASVSASQGTFAAGSVATAVQCGGRAATELLAALPK